MGGLQEESRLLIGCFPMQPRPISFVHYPGSKHNLAVVPHGVDPAFFGIGESRAHAETAEPFLLTVSTLHPHKNIDRLLQAFARFRQSRPEFRLVIVGFEGFAATALDATRLNLGLTDSVRLTGWISREELYRLFEQADAYIAPSQFEGFGMPVSEALAAGIPTACSAIEPFDEIVGGEAVRFSPDSVEEMSDAMAKVTSDSGFRARARVSKARPRCAVSTGAQPLVSRSTRSRKPLPIEGFLSCPVKEFERAARRFVPSELLCPGQPILAVLFP